MPGWLWIAALVYHGVMCLLSASLYTTDKRRAVRGAWRVPEKRLHVVDLLGGWPGGWIARRMLRHKTSKTRFVVVFWITAAAHATALVACFYLLKQ